MKRVTEFIKLKWASLLLSTLISLPAAFLLSLIFLELLNKSYSLQSMIIVSLETLILIIYWVWIITNIFLNWLNKSNLNVSRRDWFLLSLAMIPVISAIYFGWGSFGGNKIPKTFFSNEIEISHLNSSNVPENICILEIKDKNGNKVRRGRKSDTEIILTGDWVQNSQDCLFFSPGSEPGILKIRVYLRGIPGFFLTGTSSEVYSIIFREKKDGGKGLVRVGEGQITEIDLHSETEGSLHLSLPLQLSDKAVLVWNFAGTAGWVAILILLLMILVLLFKNLQIPRQIPVFIAFIETYPRVGFIPIVIGLAILFWPSVASTSSDVTYYLSLAKNLFHGKGYVNIDLSPNIYRGPIFPLLISFSYSLFGESFRSAVVMERIFWVFTIFITYILGLKYFNYRVGFIASLLVLSTYVINASFRVLWADGPLMFAILAIQWIVWDAFCKKRGGKWFFLIGLLMGTAYLLKQTSIFIVPLPMLMWLLISEYRSRQNLKKVVIFYAVFAFFYFGWMGYIYFVGGSPEQVAADFFLGLSIISRFTSIFNHSPAVASQNSSMSLLQILTIFYNRDVADFIPIAPAILLALGYTFFQAVVKKSKPDIQLSLGLLLFSSMIPVQVASHFGFRQNLYFFVVGLICVAALIERLFDKVISRTISTAIILTVAASLLFIQIFEQNYDVIKSFPITNPETMNYFSDSQGIAQWVDEHIKPDQKIMITEREGNLLHLVTGGNRVFEIVNDCRGALSDWPAIACAPPFISFWVAVGLVHADGPVDTIFGISEPWLLSTIKAKNVSFVIVTPRVYKLYNYLKLHPGFEEETIVHNFAIFRVISPLQPISTYPGLRLDTCLGKATPEYLKNLYEVDPVRYKVRMRDEISPWMGLTDEDMATFQNWKGCTFEAAFPGEYKNP